MPAQVNWKNALMLEQAFFKCLVEQKRQGFLVNAPLLDKYLKGIDGLMLKIDKKVLPLLPMRIVPLESKKSSEFLWLKEPFKKNGDLGVYAERYCLEAGIDVETVVGPFSRFHYIEFDLGSGAQIKDYLLGQGWIPNEWNYSKKFPEKRTSPKLNKDDDFIGVKGPVGKLVAKRMIYKHRKGLLEGLRKIIRPDGRITAGVTGIAATGRLKHTGVVNIPGSRAILGKQCRKLFMAPKGYRIVGCDAASCQIRMLCHYMGDDAYSEAAVSGKQSEGTDIHSVNMKLTGLDDRDDAKTLIYAFLFGGSDKRLAASLGVTLARAKKIRVALLKGLPKLGVLIDGVTAAWKKRGYLIGLDGRKLYPRAKHMTLVYLLQGAEAILMKVATCYAVKWIKESGYDARMITHQHDEYQFEVREDQTEVVGKLLAKAIEQAGVFLNLNVPMGGDFKVGLTWMETH